MPEKTERTLVDEIVENARRDRKRLEGVADGLTRGFGAFGDTVKEEGEPLDPEVSAAFAEEIAKVTDALTKINQQLVELVKVDIKKVAAQAENNKSAAPGSKISKKEAEDIYDELAGPDSSKQELN